MSVRNKLRSILLWIFVILVLLYYYSKAFIRGER